MDWANVLRDLTPGSLLWWARWAQHVPGLEDAPVLRNVLVALALETRDGSGRVWPSVARLERMTSYKTRAVKGALTGLEEMGLIERRARYRGAGTDGGRTSSLCVLAGPQLDGIGAGDALIPVHEVHGPRVCDAPQEETSEETSRGDKLSPQPHAAAGRVSNLEASFSELCALWPDPLDGDEYYRAYEMYEYAVQQGDDPSEILAAVMNGEADDHRDMRGWLARERAGLGDTTTARVGER